MEKQYSIYIIASPSDVLYIWVTNNLIRRIQEHRKWSIEWFSKKYWCTRLVYYESWKYIYDAIAREKELKGWGRKKKIELIATMNPKWKDYYDEIIL